MSPKKMWRGRGSGGGSPPEGYFASPTGSATGAGTYADPWTLKQAILGGYPTNTVQPGDTVWLRGGTYVVPSTPMGVQGNFDCALHGTSGNPITFRSYPGELAYIDGNYDNGVAGNIHDNIAMTSGEYLVFRNLCCMNSNTYNNRICMPTGAPPDARGDGFGLNGAWCKVINNIIHDCGEGMGCWSPAVGGEAYGNLIYHNGYWNQNLEPDCAAGIDIPPAGGTPVALSGAHSHTANSTPGGTLTFSHNHTGDRLVVMAVVNVGTGYANISATYNGVSMTRVVGQDNPDGLGVVAMFELIGPPTGAHDVVITTTDTNARMLGMAQSVVNSHGATASSIAGQWAFEYPTVPPYTSGLPPFYYDAVSSANHLIIDGAAIYGQYAESFGSYTTYGDATLIGWATETIGNNSSGGMSYKEVTSSDPVRMGWTWTPGLSGHGHGTYFQEAIVWEGNIKTTAGVTTVTATYGGAIFFPWNVGNTMVIDDPVNGVEDPHVCTITAYNDGNSVEVSPAPPYTNQNANWLGLRGKWAPGKSYRANILYDQFGYAFQAYGSSGTGALNCDVSDNVFVYKTAYFGGLTNYRLDDSRARRNYGWEAGIDLGYHMATMGSFEFTDNYIAKACGEPNTPITMTDNTFIGTVGWDHTTEYTDNTYYITPSTPAANLIVVQDNEYQDAYDAKFGAFWVYNWEDLDTVSVNLSSIVPNGTAIDIRNAQDYFADPVWSGTYGGGSITIPETGTLGDLTAAAGVAYTAMDPTGRGFNCFIVLMQGRLT